MMQAIVASFPVDSRFVPSCLESIIDKKVSGAALNILEKLIDWFCRWFYCPYQSLYNHKMSRVHIFSDGMARLFDSTRQGIAGIDFDWKNDYVSIFKRNVHFSSNPNIEMVFSRQAFTDYVIVKDDERRPGWVRIIEQEIPRTGNRNPMEKTWFVNTRQTYYNGPQNQPIYVVEQARQRAAI